MIENSFISLSKVRYIYLFTTVFLVALSFFVYLQIVNLIESSNLVNHTYQVNHSLKRVIKLVIDAESNQKSFLLIGNLKMLEKRESDFIQINSELKLLDSLTRDNPEQNENVNKLRELINTKLLNLEKMEQTYTQAPFNLEFKISLLEGFRQNENILTEILRMVAIEDHLLEKRTQSYNRLADITPIFIIFLSLGALLILLGSYFRLNKALNLALDLQAEVKEANMHLEEKNEELIKRGEQFFKIFDNSPVAMTFGELETNQIVYANTLFYELFGYSKGEVIGRTSEELNLVSAEENARLLPIILGYLHEERSVEELKVLPADERAKLLIRLKEKMFERGFEVVYTKKNGDTFFAIVFFEVIDIGNKKFALSTFQDISEMKKVTKDLEQKNKSLESVNKELESVNYISSHDLQEPLRQIQVFSSRIAELEQQNLSENGKVYFEKMNNAAKRMQNLIIDLLAYSRTKTEARKFKTININELINDVIDAYAEIIDEKHAIIEVDELGDANVIPFQFRQLLYNLIGNALKFSKPDTPPHIKITKEIVHSSQIPDVQSLSDRDYFHFSITDNGIGFEPKYKERIFEVFQRLHDKQKIAGTGIGLAIVKIIVENHNGIIKAKGELNEGACFDFYIPISQIK